MTGTYGVIGYMTRSTAREIAVHLVFGMDYTHTNVDEVLETLLETGYYSGLSQELELYQERPNKKQLTYIRTVAQGCAAKSDELDEIIARYAIGWPVARISRLVKAILRVAIFEVCYVDDVPTGVAINEAVRMTRNYEDEEVVVFVNGILGAFARAHQAETEE
ncbi:MAG: transcription antitermination factor NusB [Ruminococcaceae bacterium]|nr:transcription antitermination factor NusB [Oscillospiraceae bacterium]